MSILICQSCGFILRGKSKYCASCGTQVSTFASTELQVASPVSKPLMINVKPDPLVIEKVLLRQQAEQHGNGNLGHDSTSQDKHITFAPLPESVVPPESTIFDETSLAGEASYNLSLDQEDETANPKLLEAAVSDQSQWQTDEVSDNQLTKPSSVLPFAAPQPVILSDLSVQDEPLPTETNDHSHNQTTNEAVEKDLFDFFTMPISSPATDSNIQGQPTLNTASDQLAEPPIIFSPNEDEQFNAEQPINQPMGEQDASPPDQANLTMDFFSQNPPPTPKASETFLYPDNDQTLLEQNQASSIDFFGMQDKAGSESAFEFASPQATDNQAQPLIIPEEEEPTLDTANAIDQETAAQPVPTTNNFDPEKTTTKEESQPPSSPPASKLQSIIAFCTNIDAEVNLFGRNWSKKHLLIAGAIGLFIGLQVLTGLFGFVSKTLSQAIKPGAVSTDKYPSLAGTWELAFQAAGAPLPHNGQMYMQQNGNDIGGEGRDDEYFQFRGTFNPPTVLFNKQYIVDGKPVNQVKRITYKGEVTFAPNEAPYMAGIFEAEMVTGTFLHRHTDVVRGRWEAQMTQPASGSKPGQLPEEKESDPKKMHSFFLQVALCFLAFGGLLVLVSLKLFGPAGLINIWAKKEYIPSQFKSQHNKMLKELGKPLKPGGLPLGEREDWNITKFMQPKELHLTADMRDQNPHMIVIGAGAKGKTRLLANMITHDIQSADRAVVVIDSDGHLVDLILRWVGSHAKGREFAKRIMVIDPTNKDGCAGFNPLEAPEDNDFQTAASSVVYGFKAIYTEPPGAQSQWNQQTANILRNSALLLMANGKTLTDLPTLLGDNDFRDVLLEKIEKRKSDRVEFITLLDQWAQYKRLARTDQWINWVEPILNRVSPMLGDPRIRPILTKPKGDLNLRQVISDQRVLLVKIPQGQLDQNANLLGSLLVTGLKQAALSIASTSTRRHCTALYLDEFDNFIEKETFDAITSETRKFQIGFAATVKSLQHLPEDFRNQLIINVGMLLCFSLAKKDADLLGPQMFRVDGRKVKHQTLQNIFNKVNTSPQFELISDEEKLNIDRLVGQEERTYFCYRVGTIAGVFHMKAHQFEDIADKDVNWALIDETYGNKKERGTNG